MSPQTPRNVSGRHWALGGMLMLESWVHTGPSVAPQPANGGCIYFELHKAHLANGTRGNLIETSILLFGPADLESFYFCCIKATRSMALLHDPPGFMEHGRDWAASV